VDTGLAVPEPAFYREERVERAVESRLTPPAQTQEQQARLRAPRRRRGWVVRRVLVAADIVGLLLAFVVAELILANFSHGIDRRIQVLFVLFVLSLPAWVLAAKLYGLYDRDEERTDHSTTDDFSGVFHLVTVLVWVLFWALAIAFVVGARILGRSVARRSAAYIQKTVVVGTGEVGQLIARKYVQHPEYGIRLVGLLDVEPHVLRDELDGIPVLPLDEIVDVVRRERVERVVIT